jgi:acetyl esterase/lipase
LWEYPAAARPGINYPPAFVFQADDDPTVSSDNAARIYLALKDAHTSAELHIFKRGGHGFGIRDTKGPNSRWPELCGDWMREISVLK